MSGIIRLDESFIKVDHRLYRGPQPDLASLATLKAKGLTTVYNLRTEDFYPSESLCGQLSLKHIRIPVVDHSVPNLQYVQRFVRLVLAQPMATCGLVHCLAGQGRTGVFVACYRIACGMEPKDAVRLTQSESGPMTEEQRNWVMARFSWPKSD